MAYNERIQQVGAISVPYTEQRAAVQIRNQFRIRSFTEIQIVLTRNMDWQYHIAFNQLTT